MSLPTDWMLTPLNQRKLLDGNAGPGARKASILVAYPDDRFEAVVVQWEYLPPTVLIQLKTHPKEPIQFPGLRPHIPGNVDLPKGQSSALDSILADFVDPTTGLVFAKEAWLADLLFSANAFSALQPEPDLVLPADPMWECRREGLVGARVADRPGLGAAETVESD